MGSAVKTIGSTLGIGTGAAPKVDSFELSKQAQALQDSVDAEQFRESQAGLVSSLEAQMRGEGPSLAQEQLKAGTDRNLQQQMAAAASTRQSSPNTARNLLRSQAETGQKAAQQASQLRAQEQLQAQSQLGNVLQGARGQDIQSIVSPEQLRTQAFGAETAANAALQAEAMKQQSGIAGGLVEGIAGGLIPGLGAAKEFLGGLGGGKKNAPSVGNFIPGQANIDRGPGSDKSLKKDIEDAGDDVTSFLDALSANKFKYKDPEKEGEGDHFGIMAQDLEKSDVGKSFVVEDEDGTKRLDTQRGFGAVLAAQAEMHKKIKEIESRFPSSKKSKKKDKDS